MIGQTVNHSDFGKGVVEKYSKKMFSETYEVLFPNGWKIFSLRFFFTGKYQEKVVRVPQG